MSLQRYKTNPFTKDMVIPVKGRTVTLSALGKDDNILINQNTGEVHGTHIATYKKVDSEQFVKLFTQNIGFTFNLKSPGIKTFGVLVWALQHKSIGSDQIDLDSFTLDDFLQDQDRNGKNLKLSLATFKRGITELEKAQIIAKTIRKGRYFINPNFCFNGNRIAFSTIIEKEDESQPSLFPEEKIDEAALLVEGLHPSNTPPSSPTE